MAKSKKTHKPSIKKRLTGAELLALPSKEQDRLLSEAAKKARKDYLPGGALRMFDVEEPHHEY